METLKDGRVMTVVGLHTRPDLMPKVAELIFAEWTNFWKDLGYHDAESVTKWLETITGPNSLPYYGVGLVDDKIACIAGVDATEREGDTRGPWLIDVLVLPEFRSTGVFKPIVSIGNGSQDLLQRLFDLLLDPEDTILVEQYTYSGALAAIWPVGCEMVEMSFDEHGLDPDALETLLTTWPTSKRLPKVLYLVPVAHNPTGTSLSNDRKRKIVKLASRFNLAVIEDDPYWNLNFPNPENTEPRQSIWSMDEDARVIRLESLSKITAVGYRVGWAYGPKRIIEKLGYDLEAGAQSASGIAQLIVHEMIKPLWDGGLAHGWDAHVSRIRQTYYDRWVIVSKALTAHMSDLADWESPKGGMFAWIRLRGLEDTRDFVKTLAEEHLVLTVPGAAFSSNPNAKSPFIRLSFSFASTELIEPAISKIGQALSQYLSKRAKE